MFEINPVKNRIQDLTERSDVLRGIFDYDAKKERLEEVNAELEQPDVWNEPERAQALGKERSSLEAIVDTLDQMSQGLEDVAGLLELAVKPTTKRPSTKPSPSWIRWKRSWRSLSSAACSPANTTAPIATSIFRPVPAAPKPRTGPAC
jgi:exonuclease VII small subunit